MMNRGRGRMYGGDGRNAVWGKTFHLNIQERGEKKKRGLDFWAEWAYVTKGTYNMYYERAQEVKREQTWSWKVNKPSGGGEGKGVNDTGAGH